MRLAIAGLLGLFLLGCGPKFDPPDELRSLRVLAVHKDVPYAQPGQTVNLEMLWEDASIDVLDGAATRTVQVAWSSACFDPPGDLYYACFADPTLFGGGFGLGNTTSFVMPKDIISRRPPPSQARNAPYGIAYVFFAACAGTLTPLQGADATAFPIGCKDDKGNLLGSDDFVAGYASVYSFASFSNNNPVISGFSFNGKPLSPEQFCQGDACLAQAGSTVPPTVTCDPTSDALCLPTCAADGDSSCTAYSVKPTLVQTDNQELDSVSAKLVGRDVTEQMWINYYTDGGSFKSPVRLLNDATSGWNDSYDTDFYAPKAVGPSRIWAVVHDNRGGVSWAGITVNLQ
jgi:hypothetical protein